MENSLISVIVPVYNVEPYLRKCLDSIISQTYRNIEIIVIDDGSTDGCPQICDEYREKDGRVVVFHTENRGLSAARNLGIDHAHGEWIMFVDSDDWVEPDFCHLPYEAAEKYGADLVIFQMRMIRTDGVIHLEKPSCYGIISAHTAVACGHSAAWNKLYHRKLFDGCRYPEGRVAEDTAITHKLVYRAKRIVLISDILYNYQRRADSISGRVKDASSYRDLFLSHLEKYEDLLACGYPKNELEGRILREALRYLIHMEPSSDGLYDRAKRIVSNYQESTDGLRAYERNALKIWRLNEELFHNLYRARGKKVTSDVGQSDKMNVKRKEGGI